MNETTNDLDTLRLDIARALGYFIAYMPNSELNGPDIHEPDYDFMVLVLCTPDGTTIGDELIPDFLPHDAPWERKDFERRLFAADAYPDWPRDVAAALALCLEIFDKGQGDVAIGYEPTEPENLRYIAYLNSIYDSEIDWNNRHCYHCHHPLHAEGPTPAEALARLALAALRGGK